MEEDQNRIIILLDKYSQNEVSEDEFQELCRLLNNEENEAVVKAKLSREITESPFTEIESAQLKGLFEGIITQQHTPLKKLNQQKKFSIGWWKYAAAAIIIVMAGVCVYYSFIKSTGSLPLVKTPAAKVAKDFLPGGNKAVLTLGDGNTIVLDSAKDGALAVQGNTEIVKAEGSLTYNQQRKDQAVVYNSITTHRGGQYQLMLADGSKVWLNAASSIRFPTAFTGKERLVEISGEAYFEVTKNASKPFIVLVNNMKVEVLGTSFNINSYSDEPYLKATLLEGKISVSINDSKNILAPGQQAQLTDNNTLKIVDKVNVDQIMAWKNGVFNFDGADLPTVMRQVARWYDVDIIYKGTVTKEPFKGEISRNVPASKVLQMLEYLGVRFKIEGKTIVVLSS